MKLLVIALAASPAAAFAASVRSETSQIAASVVRKEQDAAECVSYTKAFIDKPMKKHMAVEKAMDHCVLDKKVDDNNFVCPHYRDILSAAFRREPTDRLYTAESFCAVAETYVSQLGRAAKIPHMGEGAGFDFEVSKGCKGTVLASLGSKKALPSRKAPDFWYALCMNQDCAHYLPSRMRWCNYNHAPTHSASVCEAIRLYASDDVSLFGPKDLDADQVCQIYDEFVEYSHINVEAYLHVVHDKQEHPVPSPHDKDRALESAKMKNQAGKNKLRDSAGAVVKSAALPGSIASFVLVFGGFALH